VTQENVVRYQRPVIISVLCVLSFGLYLYFAVPRAIGYLSSPPAHLPQTMIGEAFGLAILLAGLLGYWMMLKWGVLIYLVMTIFGGIGLGMAVATNDATTSQWLGVILPAIMSVVGFGYFKKMRWN